jgi:hypothetical protein
VKPKFPDWERDEVLNKQTTYDPETKTYTAHCALCGAEQRIKKRWYWSRDKTAYEVQRLFNHCAYCGRFVCDNCFRLCYEDNLCDECADEYGWEGEHPEQLPLFGSPRESI